MTATRCAAAACESEDIHAHGLCSLHYKRSNRKRNKAGASSDEWDWPHHKRKQTANYSKKAAKGQQPARGPKFTGAAARGRGGDPLPPSPGRTRRTSADEKESAAGDEGSTAARVPNVRSAVEAVLAGLPEADQEGWRAELARSLARTVDEQLLVADVSASVARELRAVMKELEGDTAEEGDALDQLAAVAAQWSVDADGDVDAAAGR